MVLKSSKRHILVHCMPSSAPFFFQPPRRKRTRALGPAKDVRLQEVRLYLRVPVTSCLNLFQNCVSKRITYNH